MRWGYLIPRLIIIGLIWAFMAFGFDPLMCRTATQTLQSMTGAKADIHQFSSGFFPPRLNIGALALASHRKPGTNIVEFERMQLGLAGDPLLRKSFVVDKAVVTGLRFGTVRNDNGQLETSEDDEPAGPLVPAWLKDMMKGAANEWLEDLTAQAKRRVDPKNLESYRVGNELYVKWDDRFEKLNQQIDFAKQEIERLKKQIEDAKQGETIEQIEKYLAVAQRADLLTRQSRTLLAQVRANVPLELRRDFARLDQARKTDQQMALQTIQLLKPDPRRISESLLGPQMYLQLQQLLSWVETIRGYQQDLKAPAAPERQRGRDFEFELFNPTPRFLCRRMAISGELMLSDVPTPFSAELSDVTSDPGLLGRPSLLRVSTAGEIPVELVVQHDATQEISRTDLGVDYVNNKVQKLTAGKVDGDQFVASMNNMHWNARLSIVENRLSGTVNVTSRFAKPQISVRHRLAASLATLAEDTLSEIETVTATLNIDGTITSPGLTMTSDLGNQIASGFEGAFASFLPAAKEQLVAEVAQLVDKQKAEFQARYGARYQEFEARHKDLISGLQQAHQIAMELRSGRMDAQKVFRLASESGVLKEKDQEKVDKYLGEGGRVLKGLQNPEKTIQDALPKLRSRLFK